MNTRCAGAVALTQSVLVGVKGLHAVDVAVCPPAVYLHAVARVTTGSPVWLGAQDVCAEGDGSYTGEISTGMLLDCDCSFVIVGHSERRVRLAESDAVVAAKFQRAMQAGLSPILCVGETLEERIAGNTEATVARQLDAVLEVAGATGLGDGVIAYEPLWAIGSGHTATPIQADKVHAFLRDRIGAHNLEVATNIRILYGGSMKANNAAALMAQPNIDGGLIGGASLQAAEFIAICSTAA